MSYRIRFSEWLRSAGPLLVVATALALLLGGCASTPPSAAPESESGDASTAAAQRSELEEEWGIKLLGIRPSAAGYVLDFRYEVLDAEKATPILQRKYAHDPHVIVEKSGAILRVPFSAKVGSMRNSVRTANQIKPHRRYFMLFANPGRHVESGDRVTVVIGNFRAEHVVVQ